MCNTMFTITKCSPLLKLLTLLYDVVEASVTCLRDTRESSCWLGRKYPPFNVWTPPKYPSFIYLHAWFEDKSVTNTNKKKNLETFR